MLVKRRLFCRNTKLIGLQNIEIAPPAKKLYYIDKLTGRNTVHRKQSPKKTKKHERKVQVCAMTSDKSFKIKIKRSK